MTFQGNDNVVVHSTGDLQLDGRKGTITGRTAQFPEMAFYIVSFETPIIYDDGFTATSVQLTEYCLQAA